MKLLIFVILMLVTLPARSMESICSSLFSAYPYPPTQMIESDLFKEAKAIFPLIKAVSRSGYLQVLKPRVDFIFEIKSSSIDLSARQKFEEIFLPLHAMYSLKNYITKKHHEEHLRGQLDLRYKGTMTGIIMRTIEYLKSQSISHTLDYNNGEPFIEISTKGVHHYNRLAKNLKAKYDLEVTIDIFALVRSGGGGMYNHSKLGSKNGRTMQLHPEIFYAESLFQNPGLLHEYNHHLNIIEKTSKPYHGYVELISKKKSHNLYENYFSIDELSAYRTSIRTLAHLGITSKNVNSPKYYLSLIQNQAKRQIGFSEIILDTMTTSKELKHYVTPRDNTIYEKDNKKFAEDLYDMTRFTKLLYGHINQKINEKQNASPQEQRALLRKIVKILSSPRVKELKGSYPTAEEIQNEL